MQVICKRCLLSEFADIDTRKTVAELIETLPENIRADDETYQNRLNICKECEHLYNGMCGKCGCYVELRALKKEQKCPHEKHYW